MVIQFLPLATQNTELCANMLIDMSVILSTSLYKALCNKPPIFVSYRLSFLPHSTQLIG